MSTTNVTRLFLEDGQLLVKIARLVRPENIGYGATNFLLAGDVIRDQLEVFHQIVAGVREIVGTSDVLRVDETESGRQYFLLGFVVVDFGRPAEPFQQTHEAARRTVAVGDNDDATVGSEAPRGQLLKQRLTISELHVQQYVEQKHQIHLAIHPGPVLHQRLHRRHFHARQLTTLQTDGHIHTAAQSPHAAITIKLCDFINDNKRQESEQFSDG